MKFIRNLKGTCSWRFIVVFAFLITGVNAQESNLSGGWIMNERGSWQGLVTTESAELVLAKFDRSVDDPSMRCIAPGLIRATESQAPLEIVEQDHQILILYEALRDANHSAEFYKLLGAGHGNRFFTQQTMQIVLDFLNLHFKQ